jgi:hypothetical protein
MKTRRDFLRASLRCGGLIALGGGASLLGWRSVHGDCVRLSPCGECPLFKGCDLEKALDSKKTTTPNSSAHV